MIPLPQGKKPAVADTEQFTIGTGVSCSDGPVGRLSRVIVDPVAEKVTHLVVEPRHRGDLGRLVPLDLVDGTAGEVLLRCTQAEFEQLERALETRFIPATSGYDGYGGGGIGAGDGTPAEMVTTEAVPRGAFVPRICRPQQHYAPHSEAAVRSTNLPDHSHESR